MKKLLSILTALIAFMCLSCTPIFAQGAGDTSPDYTSYFYTFGGLVLLIPFVAEFFKRLVKTSNSTLTQFISWMVGLGVTTVAWALQLGFLGGLLWWQMIIVGLLASLASNGVFDVGLCTWILSALKIKSSAATSPTSKAK